ncbi:hypothetical protein MFTT_30970 [Mycolicibacterium fortuitum subsp. fortuitum]|nr:hypothetical protein MFTT_30970 [Mycolicibacterium fortuitum subsp. fortuitum]
MTVGREKLPGRLRTHGEDIDPYANGSRYHQVGMLVPVRARQVRVTVSCMPGTPTQGPQPRNSNDQPETSG